MICPIGLNLTLPYISASNYFESNQEAYLLEKFNFVVDVMKNGPMEKMESFVHEEFLFFKEYGMQDRDEWLSEIKELVEGDWQFTEPNLLAENEDLLVFNHIVLDDDQKFRVTAVNFLKDGQTWRLSTHRTLIKD